MRVAETLGCFCADIYAGMSLDELADWAAWFQLQNEAQTKAAKEAEQEAKRRGRRR